MRNHHLPDQASRLSALLNRQSSPQTISTTLKNAYGTIPYNMTNDYMFRAVLQSNNKVLRGLVCSLLHLSEDEVISVEVLNSIILGDAIEDKECRLDINVRLNDHTLINLEMQVTNQLNWPERSVTYLCRSFDDLHHGQDYIEARPVIHIGFLDYTLFNECPEFYATYKLLNVKTHQIYSDNLTLSVVELSRIDLATEEDKQYHIDDWAKLFKATTWEEVRMLAAKNEYLNETAKTIFQMSADEIVRKRCRDREEYYQDIRNYEKTIAAQENALAEQKHALAEQKHALAKQKHALAERDTTISNYEKALAEKEAENKRLLAEIDKLKQKH